MTEIRAVFSWWQAALVLAVLVAIATASSARAEHTQEIPLFLEFWTAADHDGPEPMPMVQMANQKKGKPPTCPAGTLSIQGWPSLCGVPLTVHASRHGDPGTKVTMPLRYRYQEGKAQAYIALPGLASNTYVYEIEADPFFLNGSLYAVHGVLHLIFMREGEATVVEINRRIEGNPFLAEVHPGTELTKYLEVAATEIPHASR